MNGVEMDDVELDPLAEHPGSKQNAQDDLCRPFERQELVRVLLQSLHNLGLDESYEALRRETQVDVESLVIAQFRDAVLRGDWKDAGEHLSRAINDASVQIKAPSKQLTGDEDTLGGSSPHAQGVSYIWFQLYMQQYLELLELGHTANALRVLREHLTPFTPNAASLQPLSSLILCGSTEELYERAKWDGARGKSRRILLERIEQVVDSSCMMPSDRLIHLLEQAVAYQRLQNPYYSAKINQKSSPSLLTDFTADTDLFPRENTHVLQGHSDEVWTLRFSPSGDMLATAGRDRIVTVWDMKNYKALMRLEHRDPVASMDFSIDERRLLVASEEEVTVWNLDTKQGLSYVEHQHTVTAVRYLKQPSTNSALQSAPAFVSGAMDHTLVFWNSDGSVESRKDLGQHRITSLDVSHDGHFMIVVACEPSPVKAEINSRSRGTETRSRSGSTDESMMSLLPFSLAGGAFIPYDLRHLSAIGSSRTNSLDLLNYPTDGAESRRNAPRTRRAIEQTCDALEGRAASSSAVQNGKESPTKNRSRIMIYDLVNRKEVTSLFVEDALNHVVYSPDSQYALLSAAEGNCILLETATHTLQQRYHGHKSSEFVIRAAFGGSGEDLAGGLSSPFVISGSEDAHIFFWHRATGRFIECSCQHPHGCVNDVAWRPNHSAMMVSGGDDASVRIWEPGRPVGETLYHTTSDKTITPSQRSGTYASSTDWKRPHETNEESMEDESDDSSPTDSEQNNRQLHTMPSRVDREAMRNVPTGRIRRQSSPDPSISAGSPQLPRPNLMPW
ncbi:hypothetical protein MYAM1_001051 [Malassezia yamatoensis]|uniref:CTLH domain-containing protein n=1 Tax=Malassezia yamatoensis TaxID=253288 RepID=A0AAJ5YQL7_9BASI|nr:hypothetical protein MYAM1_001051 [Malassezia yamatoensis]